MACCGSIRKNRRSSPNFCCAVRRPSANCATAPNGLCAVGDLQAVEELLRNLAEREVPLVTRLPRQPGRKEHRYTHLLAGEPDIEQTSFPTPEAARIQVQTEDDRISRLETEVVVLRDELAEIRRQLGEFKSQFE